MSSLFLALWRVCVLVYRCLLLTSGSAVDAAVSKALKPEQASAAAGPSAQQQSMAQFAQAALSSHSAHAPLAGSSTTIADAMDSPSAELRRMVSDPLTVCLITAGNLTFIDLAYKALLQSQSVDGRCKRRPGHWHLHGGFHDNRTPGA